MVGDASLPGYVSLNYGEDNWLQTSFLLYGTGFLHCGGNSFTMAEQLRHFCNFTE